MKKAYPFFPFVKQACLMLLAPVIAFSQSGDKNYVKTIVYKDSTSTPIASPTSAQAMTSVTYVDALGRPEQKIFHAQSGTGKDIIQPIEYDMLGREPKSYMPFPSSGSSMSFDPASVTNVASYYSGEYGMAAGNPYVENVFEASPLHRVLKQGAPGEEWGVSHPGNNDRSIKFGYLANSDTTAYGKVRLYQANAVWDDSADKGYYQPTLTNSGGSVFYEPNTLFRTLVKDENWTGGSDHTIEEFHDLQGKLVLQRRFNIENSQVLDTYFVYDQYGNLTYVIPPQVNTSQAITQAILDNLCYQYKYDGHNRLVEKKLPGKNQEYIIYDKLDRVIATGPAKPPFPNLSSNSLGWLVIKYDAFNRPVLTGWMYSASAINGNLRKSLQLARDSDTAGLNESRTASTADVTVSGVTFRYSNAAWPVAGYHVLSVTYYDDYNFPDAPSPVPSEVEGQSVHYNNINPPKGMVTGTWVRAVRSSTSYRNEKSYILYDYKARPIRVFKRNNELGAGGRTEVDTKFDFSGKILYTITRHKRIDSETAIVIKDMYEYSDQDRLVGHSHQINSNPVQLMSANSYDEMGRLVSQNVGNTAQDPLQKVDYTYNIRGWLTGINDTDDLSQSGAPTDLFALRINYQNVQNSIGGVIKPLYNGNISEVFWKSASDNELRSYSYRYDPINRLTDAVYFKNNEMLRSYDETVQYDKNGNITHLARNGDVEDIAPALEIDNLTYGYQENSNRLVKVSDPLTPASGGFLDGTNTDDDYEYDQFGNLISDKNKGITNIQYNHLNLPLKITFGATGEIEYVYNGHGRKLEKIVTVGTQVTTTKYMDGFQYEDNVLKFFPTGQGYVVKTGSSYQYVFTFRDHVGNIRLKYSDADQDGQIGTGEIIEESHYYPFGLRHSGYNSLPESGHRYRFNGQEWQEELGLNVTAMDFRQYDNAIGRFHGMDRLAELAPGITPYRFGFNNPNFWSDPTGLFETWFDAIEYMLANNITGEIVEEGGVYEIRGYGEDKEPFMFIAQVGGQIITGPFVVGGGGSNGGAMDANSGDGSCPNCLNPSTTGNNLWGLTYPGGNNPRSYNGQYNYSYVPTNLSEYPAIGHDRRYDNLKITGASGLFTDTRAIGADWRFVAEELSIAANPFLNPIDRVSAGILGIGLGKGALPKTLYQLSSPFGYSQIMMWYNISNQGVNNAPTIHKH